GVAVEVEVIGCSAVPVTGKPRLDDARAKPNIIVVLARVAALAKSEGVRIALGERDEARRSNPVHKLDQVPAPVAARLVTQQRIHQVTGPVLYPVYQPVGGVHKRPGDRQIVRAAVNLVAGPTDALLR